MWGSLHHVGMTVALNALAADATATGRRAVRDPLRRLPCLPAGTVVGTIASPAAPSSSQ